MRVDKIGKVHGEPDLATKTWTRDVFPAQQSEVDKSTLSPLRIAYWPPITPCT